MQTCSVQHGKRPEWKVGSTAASPRPMNVGMFQSFSFLKCQVDTLTTSATQDAGTDVMDGHATGLSLEGCVPGTMVRAGQIPRMIILRAAFPEPRARETTLKGTECCSNEETMRDCSCQHCFHSCPYGHHALPTVSPNDQCQRPRSPLTPSLGSRFKATQSVVAQ